MIDASSQNAGFTPGFASVLTDSNGVKTFVKAAASQAQRMFAEAYRTEAAKLTALPKDVPAARLLWHDEPEGWVVLGIEYVEGRAPVRPWRRADLDQVLDALEHTARVLTPPPAGIDWATFADELGDWPAFWEHARSTLPGDARVDEAAALAAGYAEACSGDTLTHTDIRDDNILLGDGGVRFCDWNWPVVGAAWIDTVITLIGPRGDGLDVESVIAERPLTRDVPVEHIDSLLAVVLGYFIHAADQPVPPSSPFIRAAQGWQRDVIWEWLGERRGW